jgi:hypothetical protein
VRLVLSYHQLQRATSLLCAPRTVATRPPMSQDSNKQVDTEKGKTDHDVTGIATVTCPLPSWTHKCVKLDDHPELPQLSKNQPSSPPPKGESNFGDSSGPIFSMYSKITKEEDDRDAERWQKDADGVLIFVSPRVQYSCYYAHKLCYYRPVYSPLQSPHYLPYPSRISDQVLKILPHSTLGISIKFSRIRTLHPPLRLSLNLLRFPLRYMLYG